MASKENNTDLTPVEGFPIMEEVEDFAGTRRKFRIDCHFTGEGYILDAREEGKKIGYHFSAYSETHPLGSIGDLRSKMRRMLATRHIKFEEERCFPLHDTLRGHIGFDDLRGMVFIIDGIPVSVEDFLSMFDLHEGWQFKVQFIDPVDDASL
jgi:hypothetical protein